MFLCLHVGKYSMDSRDFKFILVGTTLVTLFDGVITPSW
jgi:hypothetical protein